jgi:hypothetical protein
MDDASPQYPQVPFFFSVYLISAFFGRPPSLLAVLNSVSKRISQGHIIEGILIPGYVILFTRTKVL